MSDTLKPCPFCGASGHVIRPAWFNTRTSFTVLCAAKSCPSNQRHGTEADAITAWNTRRPQ